MKKELTNKDIEEQHKRMMAKTYLCLENNKRCKIVNLSQCTAWSPYCDIEFLDGSGTYCIQINNLKVIERGLKEDND